MEQEPKIEKKNASYITEYLMGLWDLPREQVLEKILKEKISYEVVDDQIRVSSDAVHVGGK